MSYRFHRPRYDTATLFSIPVKTQPMPSNKTIAVAPIATGALLAGTAIRAVARHGLEIWTGLAIAGGLSAVGVGLGVLTGRGGFDTDDDSEGRDDWTTAALGGLALTCVAVGAGIALA